MALALASAWVLAGCATRPGDGVQTSTGLPYWPPGPVFLERDPIRVSVRRPASADQSAANRPEAVGVPVRPAAPPAVTPVRSASGGDAWREAAGRWQGTPYRLGGDDASGIDCSAYVRALHREVSGADLPRTTAEQAAVGMEVPAGVVLMPRDLVFFRTTPREGGADHVGVALGGGEFTHAGTSTGVTLSRLDEPYWVERWVETRRFR